MSKPHDLFDIKKAVALRYRQGEDNAPVVVASGQGWFAERIMEIAAGHGIMIFEDENLVESLRVLDLGEEIPVELYKALAAILAFVFKVDRKLDKEK
ncbi:MAG: hypothetical protein GX887_01275 [Firmicutes bacterium]|nr:hypothetical protein [Bacillota bacterium]